MRRYFQRTRIAFCDSSAAVHVLGQQCVPRYPYVPLGVPQTPTLNMSFHAMARMIYEEGREARRVTSAPTGSVVRPLMPLRVVGSAKNAHARYGMTWRRMIGEEGGEAPGERRAHSGNPAWCRCWPLARVATSPHSSAQRAASSRLPAARSTRPSAPAAPSSCQCVPGYLGCEY
ncbi:hypothetical protein HYPSUDRAFT_566398 [Hypholoma sublateritium FD-334 SS-4]|uniref:Uncharacterized protein n=1 Tax=Hypholoma sublateritium (strain FD-334 SS-4) TaxID=945553 RepID=A0A0D2MJU2_HYPSF|nr:hypothetical protein HYPSUDRAFT_566398 [Hypholoma sublateritium FD-334 SS-4]